MIVLPPKMVELHIRSRKVLSRASIQYLRVMEFHKKYDTAFFNELGSWSLASDVAHSSRDNVFVRGKIEH